MELDVRLALPVRVRRPEHALADALSRAELRDQERAIPAATLDAARDVVRRRRDAVRKPDEPHDPRIAPQRDDERDVSRNRLPNHKIASLEPHARLAHVWHRGQT
jgi:hypothetical protein